ncbi:MAG: cytochrome c [Chloroflexi bacterium]|nr:cytochrome c [Chloroflexota bacterium]
MIAVPLLLGILSCQPAATPTVTPTRPPATPTALVATATPTRPPATPTTPPPAATPTSPLATPTIPAATATPTRPPATPTTPPPAATPTPPPAATPTPPPATPSPAPATDDATSGKALFTSKGCNACHPDGKQGAGPSLIGVTDRLSEDKIKQQIRDGGARMPPFPMSDKELADLIAFLKTLK